MATSTERIVTVGDYQIPNVKRSKLGHFKYSLLRYKLPAKLNHVLQAVILTALVWVVALLLTKSESLPRGQVFTLLVLEFGGRFFGYICGWCRLPPMVGMLAVGMAIRNIPGLEVVGTSFNPKLSSFVRQIALAIILTRAGLGLDLPTLMQRKSLVLRLAVLPTVLEATAVAVVVQFLLNFPWAWSFLVGFVVAPVSPAVVVPRLLALKEGGYGVEKGIPTVILASASLDNIVAISMFGVSLGFATTAGGDKLAGSILQGPLEIAMGLGSGVVWGFMLGMAFHSGHANDRNATVLRALLTFAGSLCILLGFRYFDYSGAGALGCLTSAVLASTVWKKRQVSKKSPDTVAWVFYVLWYVFEPLLFGAIGCQMDLRKLERRLTLLALVGISVGAVVRFAMTYCSALRAELSFKEKLFTAICWVPKATVQAAIGPVALDTVQKLNLGVTSEKLALDVLMIAVITILLTAPIGEIGVMITGTKFLKKMAVQ